MMMSEAVFFDTLREGLWISALMSAPILAVALIAGVGIGLFQALTSIQEMTLTFVPKLAAMIAVFWVSMSMMTDMLVAYFNEGIIRRIMEF
jgi:flagellar biosynthesis protein FliQ